MRPALFGFVCLLAAGVGIPPARADVSPERDRARTFLMLRVVDALDLSDEKALQMREILRRADDRRLELSTKRDTLEAQLRAAVAHLPRDESALTKLVDDTHAVQHELATLPEHTFAEAQKILTVEQQAKLLLFHRDLQGQVRQALRRRQAPPRPKSH
ncbi:MAG: Spy/CpxP family protein refolding chaperone [Candidatus Binatia bacterium]